MNGAEREIVKILLDAVAEVAHGSIMCYAIWCMELCFYGSDKPGDKLRRTINQLKMGLRIKVRPDKHQYFNPRGE